MTVNPVRHWTFRLVSTGVTVNALAVQLRVTVAITQWKCCALFAVNPNYHYGLRVSLILPYIITAASVASKAHSVLVAMLH